MNKLQKEFEEFHSNNPKVWDLFKMFSFDVIRTGRKHYSVNAIFERIRWHTDIETKSKNSFKLSNNHRAYYARKFNSEFPDHTNFFKTKRLRSE
jgi:hypothetical protein